MYTNGARQLWRNCCHSLRTPLYLPLHRRGAKTTTSPPAADFIKVTVCGASGGIGQPLSLMLKQSSFIHQLSLYDTQGVKGVGLDLSHCDTSCQLCSHEGKPELDAALQDASIVMILAGVPRQEGQTRDDLFQINATIVQEIAEACTRMCPKALIAVITNPVNSLVPVVCEVFQRAGIDADKRVLGVTCLDVVRANTFAAAVLGLTANQVSVPVVGGHSGKTIVPLLSKTRPRQDFTQQEIDVLTEAVQEAGTLIIKAKAGKGSATLSMAFAAARFALTLVKGLGGGKNVIECAYVRSDVVSDVRYFATPVVFGPEGVSGNVGLPCNMSDYECELLSAALPDLKKDIELGERFVKDASPKAGSRGPCCKPAKTTC